MSPACPVSPGPIDIAEAEHRLHHHHSITLTLIIVHQSPLNPTMCGPETSDRPRGGALAALMSPSVAGVDPAVSIRGDLTFHTPGRPGSTEATHARLTPEAAREMSALGDLHVVIHTSGDLTRSAEDCGLFRSFDLPGFESLRTADHVELSLDEPLSLEVGNGIIGRRVSLCSRRPCGQEVIVAEGIVGFNFAESSQPQL
ncbi:hypothetical protein HRG_005109 [Hirsutella rhossiliensis]|uniref:Uncharacterized protein n=1 Tax=Hirsutella rhossiliensis TaxID=111463 RepID=A0A9P8SJA4_9HYPO|nr:uncharacterized protein HRG_05109 [Hirsutella rhossiliensis]KAH0964681.1 hypothetical protein HRG_05109 [Hirsutella rhossiliensis]